MTVQKVKEKGSIITTEEPESVTTGPPSFATGKDRHHNKPFGMTSHPKESYGDAGDYLDPRRRSFRLAPGSQDKLTGQLVSLMPCQISLFRSFTTRVKKSPRPETPPHIEDVVPLGINPELGHIGPEGDSVQWNLARGGVDLTTATSADDGGGPQVELRGDRDGRSHSSARASTSTSAARHDDGVSGSCTCR